jgi:hypothetical protein
MAPRRGTFVKAKKDQITIECPSCQTLIELNGDHKKPLDIMLKIYICYKCNGIYYVKGLEIDYRVKNNVKYKTWKLTDFDKLEPDYYENGLLNNEIIKDWITEYGGGFSRFKWWTRF